MDAGFFYKPKETWSEFQDWKNKLKELEKEQNQPKLNGVIQKKILAKNHLSRLWKKWLYNL